MGGFFDSAYGNYYLGWSDPDSGRGEDGTEDRFVGHSFGRGIYGDRFGGDGGHGLLLCVVGRYSYFGYGFLHPLFWYMLLAILISLAGSVVVILYLAYEYGGINLNGWFFGGGTRAPFDYITTKLNVPTRFNLEGWVHACVDGPSWPCSCWRGKLSCGGRCVRLTIRLVQYG